MINMTPDEAKATALDIIQSIRYGEYDEGASRWLVRVGYKAFYPSGPNGFPLSTSELIWEIAEAGVSELLLAATHDGDAYAAAEHVAIMHIRSQRKMPASLLEFAERAITGKAKRPHRVSPRMQQRDLIAIHAINILLRAGVPLSKNQTSKHQDDACSVVAEMIRNHGEREWRNTTAGALRKVYQASEKLKSSNSYDRTS